MSGRLVLVATPLGNMADLSPRAITTLAEADVVACEDTRRTGLLLQRSGIKARLVAVHDHNEASQIGPLLDLLADGKTVALVSDAGMPAISDPGERLVRAAIDAGHPVSVVPGPSAAVSALAISGLATDRWVFEGFLPRKGGERTKQLESIAIETRTVVLYEAPHRLKTTLADLARVCGDDREVVLVRELTKVHEEVWRGSLGLAVVGSEPRGEYVVVLAGAPKPPDATDADIEAALAVASIAEVAATLGVPKRRVFAAAVRLRNPTPKSDRERDERQ